MKTLTSVPAAPQCMGQNSRQVPNRAIGRLDVREPSARYCCDTVAIGCLAAAIGKPKLLN